MEDRDEGRGMNQEGEAAAEPTLSLEVSNDLQWPKAWVLSHVNRGAQDIEPEAEELATID